MKRSVRRSLIRASKSERLDLSTALTTPAIAQRHREIAPASFKQWHIALLDVPLLDERPCGRGNRQGHRRRPSSSAKPGAADTDKFRLKAGLRTERSFLPCQLFLRRALTQVEW